MSSCNARCMTRSSPSIRIGLNPMAHVRCATTTIVVSRNCSACHQRLNPPPRAKTSYDKCPNIDAIIEDEGELTRTPVLHWLRLAELDLFGPAQSTNRPGRHRLSHVG